MKLVFLLKIGILIFLINENDVLFIIKKMILQLLLYSKYSILKKIII